MPTRPIPGLCLHSSAAALFYIYAGHPAAQAQEAKIQVIEVSGKRPQGLRDVAGTITAVNGSQLEQSSAGGFEDYLKLTPGVQLSKGEPDSAVLSIRGINTFTDPTNGVTQGTVGVYVDDVPFTDPFGRLGLPDLAPFDMERIEVMRGPQGVLYGSSSLGGALRYVLAKPDFSGTSASAMVTLGSSGGAMARQGWASVNWAAPDSATAVRIGGFARKDGGTVENLIAHSSNDLEQQALRIGVAAKLGSKLKAALQGMEQRTNVDDAGHSTRRDARLKENTPTASPRSSKNTMLNLTLEYDFGDYRVTSSTATLEKRYDASTDVTQRFGPTLANQAPYLQFAQAYQSRANSQELRIASREAGPVSFVAGAFYQKFRIGMNGGVVAPGARQYAERIYGLPAGALFSADAPDRIYREVDQARATEAALFAEAEIALGDKLSAGLGGRLYRTSIRSAINASGLLAGTPDAPRDDSTSDHGYTPRLGLKYRHAPKLMLYASMADGYRFGGNNIISADPVFPTPASFRSDKLRSWEAGLRYGSPSAAQFDMAVFRSDWRDVQAVLVRPTDRFPYVTNIGRARVNGVEALLAWRPIEGLLVRPSFAYTEAQTLGDLDTRRGAPFERVIRGGTPLPATPRRQAATELSYQFAGPAGARATASGVHTYVGRSYNDLERSVAIGGYSQVDLSLRLVWPQAEVTVFAHNAGDTIGVVSAVGGPLSGYTNYYLTKPRAVGVSLRSDF